VTVIRSAYEVMVCSWCGDPAVEVAPSPLSAQAGQWSVWAHRTVGWECADVSEHGYLLQEPVPEAEYDYDDDADDDTDEAEGLGS
jgi:hypothetical protein